jgi:RNA ligase (TIGR02306 family)
MSTFKVEVKKLSKVYVHPNADRLELGQVEGMTFQFVIPKEVYKEDDEVVYFPIDSLLPQDFIEQQGIANHLSGKSKNRVKTRTLRGEVSQGYVASVKSVLQYLKTDTLPEDLTVSLNVTKYEPPEIMMQTGNLVRLPEHVYYYDIEGCDRFPNIVEMLMDKLVVITEKVEGSNHGTSINPENVISVNQHSYAIENLPDKEEHTFWKIARQENTIEMAQKIHELYPDKTVCIRGEAIGPSIQGNYYGLSKHALKVYDLEIDGKAIDFPNLEEVLTKAGVYENWKRLFVPIIASNITLREWLNGRTIQVASSGKSMLIDKLREGIVIKPFKEEFIHRFGRLFLKQRDPIYLAGTDN